MKTKTMISIFLMVSLFLTIGCNNSVVLPTGEEDNTEITNPNENEDREEEDFPCENDILEWAVRFTLKPNTDESYLATDDPEIKALVAKYDVIFYQTYQGFKTPELLLLYTLRGKGCDKENVIKDFLATGKFEDDVYEYEITHTG